MPGSDNLDRVMDDLERIIGNLDLDFDQITVEYMMGGSVHWIPDVDGFPILKSEKVNWQRDGF